MTYSESSPTCCGCIHLRGGLITISVICLVFGGLSILNMVIEKDKFIVKISALTFLGGAMVLLDIIGAVFLMIGAIHRNPGFIWPFIVAMAIGVIIPCVLIILMFAVASDTATRAGASEVSITISDPHSIALLVGGVCVMGLKIFFIYVGILGIRHIRET